MELQKILSSECGIQPGAVIVVGISGGADSMALTHMLHTSGYQVIPAHFNHRLRENSFEDADTALALCNQLGIQLCLGGGDVQTYCKEHRKGIEEGARDLRYYFLFALAKNKGAQAVAVAHHADDQVETILMHFIRGAGLSGLKGMPYHSDSSQFSSGIPLIRPLLSTTHAELVNYCGEHEIRYIEDPSNQQDTFFRNRLRHQIIPLLEEQNPGFRQAVLRGSITLQADHVSLETMVDAILKKWQVVNLPGCVGLELDRIHKLDRGMRWNVLRKIIRDEWPDLRDFDLETMLRLDGLILDPAGHQVDLVQHLQATRQEGLLWLHTEDVRPPVKQYPQAGIEEITLELPSEIVFENGWKLVCEMISPGMADLLSMDLFEAWLDPAAVVGKLRLRRKQTGEKMSPLGMGRRHASLADLLSNDHIPVAAREAYPLVCDEQGVVWVPGICIAHRCRLPKKTNRVIRLRITRLEKTD
jgi:tRNA(Ile)-lysidine synthase